MQRDDALALACGGLCLQVHSVPHAATERARVEHGAIGAGDCTTWLVRGGRLLTLVQTGQGTRVYDHADDTLYYASPCAELPRECPEGTALLAQAVEDRSAHGGVPRLLVMDILWPRSDNPHQRGADLRGMQRWLPPALHVQWSGERAALERFLAQGMPHDVECVVALRQQGVLVRDPPALRALPSL